VLHCKQVAGMKNVGNNAHYKKQVVAMLEQANDQQERIDRWKKQVCQKYTRCMRSMTVSEVNPKYTSYYLLITYGQRRKADDAAVQQGRVWNKDVSCVCNKDVSCVS